MRKNPPPHPLSFVRTFSLAASLYYLKHTEVTEGSERVRMVIRDKDTDWPAPPFGKLITLFALTRVT